MTATMSARFGTPAFRSVAKGLVELHRLLREEPDDSPEAERIRDSLDGPLGALDEIERERAQWLSEDLYSLSDESPAPAKASRGVPERIWFQVWLASMDGDWDRALSVLRRSNSEIPAEWLSCLRGLIWTEAGYPEVAGAFYQHATAAAPWDPQHASPMLNALAAADLPAARKAANEILKTAAEFPPLVVAIAAGVRRGRADEGDLPAIDESSATPG